MAVGSFSAGLSGLNANATYLSVIGNNLANINTVGFKTSAVSFADLVSQTVGGTSVNPMQVGLGVVTGSISPVFSQGAIENTREATNVAIQGSGFFVGRATARQSPTPAPATSASTTTASWSRRTASACRATRRSIRPPATIVTTGEPSDIIVPPGVLRAPIGDDAAFAPRSTSIASAPSTGDRLHDVDADLRRARQLARR